jgi:transcription-repair coupling factor (superfamily II helicase)
LPPFKGFRAATGYPFVTGFALRANMNLEVLLKKFSDDSRIDEIADWLAMPLPQKMLLKNLNGSAAHFIFSAVFGHEKMKQQNHVVVLNDAETAAYFHNTIENLTNALHLYYFPSSFKSGRDFRQLNSSNVMLRTEALTRFSATGHGRCGVLITYPEALTEKVVVREKLSANIIYIKTGDTLDIGALSTLFVNYGFTRTDFVYEPGQFSLRGGILDIYSFGNEKPYRVELFGEEVESIRIFDPETQLSERKLLQVSIIPNIETHFEQSGKIHLVNFLPENTVIWIQDPAILEERFKAVHTEADIFILEEERRAFEKEKQEAAKPEKKRRLSAAAEEEEDPWKKTVIHRDDFTSYEAFETEARNFHQVIFGSFSGLFKADKDFLFQTREQPAFNRQFPLLISNLKTFSEQGYDLFVFAENPKQLERLHSIFTDLGTEIQFTPITVSIHEGFIDDTLKLVCYTDHQVFQRYHKYKVKQAYNKNKAITLRMLRELQPGDYVTHIDHGVGVYSGLQKIELNGCLQEAVRLIYKDNDILYVNIHSLHKISKYTGSEGSIPKINKLGSDAWNRLKEKTKTKVKEIAFDLIRLYAERKTREGFAHAPDNYMQTELEASFIYEDTPDQGKASADVKKDMESSSPMDRLVCGDVGFGKTEIAIRAAFKTCCDGRQAAILVPTTILAYQHYKTFTDRLKDFPVSIDYINRFKSAKEKKESLQKLADGKTDIIIGTHGLLGKDTHFKNLGLIIVDEEQKFGVGHKEKLKTLRSNVDALTLTATPIPRTLQFSLMGARDLSIINTPPPNRHPIETEVQVFNENVIRDAIYYETSRGGQVFFIHNRIAGIAEMAQLLNGLCPDLSIAFAHGQMEGHELEEKILNFINRKYDVLVCTNIVESGVDIPNVNTIIINNAHQFGLSDLHQLRGRVGRSNRKAFCYLLAPPVATLPDDSRKRLLTLEQHSDLGSGFQIAMRDLDIRGAGNLLGGEQSGFMAEIGFEMYHKILDEAIRELKRSHFKELFKDEIARQDDVVKDCLVDTDLLVMIPDDYVENITERLSLYSQLDNCATEEELVIFYEMLKDRFGPVPKQTQDLFATVRSRKLAVQLGFERMVLKDDTLKCFFPSRPDSPYFESEIFNRMLEFIQKRTGKARLKQSGKLALLVVDDIKSMGALHHFLKEMHAFAVQPAIQNTH